MVIKSLWQTAQVVIREPCVARRREERLHLLGDRRDFIGGDHVCCRNAVLDAHYGCATAGASGAGGRSGIEDDGRATRAEFGEIATAHERGGDGVQRVTGAETLHIVVIRDKEEQLVAGMGNFAAESRRDFVLMLRGFWSGNRLTGGILRGRPLG